MTANAVLQGNEAGMRRYVYVKKEMGCALLLHVSVTNQCLPFLNVNRVLASHLKEVCT